MRSKNSLWRVCEMRLLHDNEWILSYADKMYKRIAANVTRGMMSFGYSPPCFYSTGQFLGAGDTSIVGLQMRWCDREGWEQGKTTLKLCKCMRRLCVYKDYFFTLLCWYLLTVNGNVFNFICLSGVGEEKVVWAKLHQFNASIFNFIV